MFEKKERDLFKKSDPVETSTLAQLGGEKLRKYRFAYNLLQFD
jgi:hypothetical protein